MCTQDGGFKEGARIAEIPHLVRLPLRDAKQPIKSRC